MIELLIVGSIVTWFWLQFGPKRRLVWQRRWAAIDPVLKMLVDDARATVIYFWRTPERARDWRELRRLERS